MTDSIRERYTPTVVTQLSDGRFSLTRTYKKEERQVSGPSVLLEEVSTTLFYRPATSEEIAALHRVLMVQTYDTLGRPVTLYGIREDDQPLERTLPVILGLLPALPPGEVFDSY